MSDVVMSKEQVALYLMASMAKSSGYKVDFVGAIPVVSAVSSDDALGLYQRALAIVNGGRVF